MTIPRIGPLARPTTVGAQRKVFNGEASVLVAERRPTCDRNAVKHTRPVRRLAGRGLHQASECRRAVSSRFGGADEGIAPVLGGGET